MSQMRLFSSLKKLTVRVVYPFLELLPERLCAKAKILGNVLLHDWRMNAFGYPDYFFEFRGIDDLEIARRFEGLDGDSIRAAQRYITLQKMCYASDPEVCFYNWSGLFSAAERRDGERQMRELRGLRKRYGLSGCDSASLIHHHGLRGLGPMAREHVRGKAFIDAGACAGDSTLAFLPYSPGKVLAFEPSPHNRERYLGTMGRNSVPSGCFELCAEGLSSGDGEVYFSDCMDGTNPLSVPGETRVRLTSLDSLVRERGLCVGVIKADVEGMGLEMLKGCVETIRRDLPILSLAIYHNKDEFFGIYELIRSLDLPYAISIRALCFPWENFDLTLLAVPQ